MRRALVVEEPGRLVLAERPELEPGPHEVVVAPAFCGLCGTDLELREGAVDPAFVRYPLTLGHEWSGVVEAVGSGVAGVAVGDRCVAECIVPCGSCTSCLAGATNVREVPSEATVTDDAGVPPIVTLAPNRFSPTIVTVSPPALVPLVALIERMTGAGWIVMTTVDVDVTSPAAASRYSTEEPG